MICVSITEQNPSKIIEICKTIEMAEIRIDLCHLNINDVTKVFSSVTIPTIATCRPVEYSDAERLELLKAAISSGATYVDVEIESNKDFISEIRVFAKLHGCKLIISYHNYDCTPAWAELCDIIERCFSELADIVKIATMALTKKDVSTILSLYNDFDNLVALAMGKMGKISRIAGLVLGSPFSFASLDAEHSTAAGQMTIDEMKKILAFFE